MCMTCGCSEGGNVTITDSQSGQHFHLDHNGQLSHSHDHEHQHNHEVSHHHHHSHPPHEHSKTILLEQNVLDKNDGLAELNRSWLAERNILALNLLSSPGAGKTTLLERTIRDLAREFPVHVIEGDQETTNDARRIQATGCRVVQINTGTGCHLDASMIAYVLQQLDPPVNSLVMIENVGNLVCPALFDLGEHAKVVIASVTEGEDKPLKYPHMFRACEVILLNKMDLLPYVSFNVDNFQDYARQVNPHVHIIPLSATQGDGLSLWYNWLRDLHEKVTGV